MFDGTAVKEVAAQFRKPMEIGNHIATPNDWTLHDPASIVKAGPQADALKVFTLGALRDYLAANRDRHEIGSLAVHVVSPQVVRIVSAIDSRTRARECFVEASAMNLTDKFLDRYMSLEEFIIGLQSRFVLSDERVSLLRLFSNVKHEQVRTSSDDGISQTVTAKAGVTLVTDATVPNPVTLTPWRTFREVTQPESSFVLRVQSNGSGSAPQVGLFEADGGAWKLTAVGRVADWLVDQLKDTGVAVLA